MCDGYQAIRDDDDHAGLEDEFLCEYVDGTMEPVVRKVFEEYLRANPELAEHVQCLRDTRMMLCQYGCRRRAPEGLQARLRRQLACEMMRAQLPRLGGLTNGLHAFVAFSSAMALMLIVGMMAGAALYEQQQPANAQTYGAEGSAVRYRNAGQGTSTPWRDVAQPGRPVSHLSGFGLISSTGSWMYEPAEAVMPVVDTLGAQGFLQRNGAAP